MNINEIISELTQRIAHLSMYFLELTESQRQSKPDPNKWSKKEILGHLVDSAQTNIRRLVIAQYQEKANTVYDQNFWVAAADYQNYDSADLCNLWVSLNKHFCIVLKNMPTQNYETLVDWGKEKADLVTVSFMVQDYVDHMDSHIKQMKVS